MTYFAYLDEFGHVGPYIARSHHKYRESPVFGLAGFVLPVDEVRGFGTWFYQRKCELLAFEITRSGKHPALWEKKGASLYTVTNVCRYPELRRFTNRLLNRIEALGGFVLHVGIRKTAPPERHDPNRLYARVFLEAIKRIDQFCAEDCDPPEDFVLILDEHNQRPTLVAQAAQSMYGRNERRRHLIELLSRRSMSRATATRRFRPPTGSRGWSDAWARSWRSRRFDLRTKSSGDTSSSGSTASAAAAVFGVNPQKLPSTHRLPTTATPSTIVPLTGVLRTSHSLFFVPAQANSYSQTLPAVPYNGLLWTKWALA